MDTKLLLKSKTILGILITAMGGALGQTNFAAILPQLIQPDHTTQVILSSLIMTIGGVLGLYGRVTSGGTALRVGKAALVILNDVLSASVKPEPITIAAENAAAKLVDEKGRLVDVPASDIAKDLANLQTLLGPKPGAPFSATSYPSPLHAVAAAMEAGQIPKDQKFLDLYFPSAPLAAAPAEQAAAPTPQPAPENTAGAPGNPAS